MLTHPIYFSLLCRCFFLSLFHSLFHFVHSVKFCVYFASKGISIIKTFAIPQSFSLCCGIIAAKTLSSIAFTCLHSYSYTRTHTATLTATFVRWLTDNRCQSWRRRESRSWCSWRRRHRWASDPVRMWDTFCHYPRKSAAGQVDECPARWAQTRRRRPAARWLQL